jgi:mannose-6-phosphate isomerase-like protein (cupin superfamily)
MDGSMAPTGPKVTIARKASAAYTTGRRVFFKYRDLGVQDATGGKIRAQVMEALTGMTEPTGWHVHHCEAQFVYVLKGWVDLEFEDGTRTRCEAGDAILIPGGGDELQGIKKGLIEIADLTQDELDQAFGPQTS